MRGARRRAAVALLAIVVAADCRLAASRVLAGAASRRCASTRGRARLSALVDEGDIVEYRLPPAELGPDGKRLGVGCVYDGCILPLCKWSADSEDFMYDEDVAVHKVALSEAVRALDMNRVWHSNRLVGGGMGPGNPHGEESEDCWSLADVQLSEETRIVVRPEREVWW